MNEREFGVRARLVALANKRRNEAYAAWLPKAKRAAMFPGILLPLPGRKAWWNRPEVRR